MRFQKIPLYALAAGTIALCTSIYLIILAKPHCEDSNLKTWLVGIGLFGQWPLAGLLTGYLARTRGWWYGFIVSAIACPFGSALWLGLLWGWDRFSLTFYWSILQGFCIAGIPLTIFGGFLGSVFYAKFRTSSPQVA